jgi:hypothetical protein
MQTFLWQISFFTGFSFVNILVQLPLKSVIYTFELLLKQYGNYNLRVFCFFMTKSTVFQVLKVQLAHCDGNSRTFLSVVLIEMFYLMKDTQ